MRRLFQFSVLMGLAASVVLIAGDNLAIAQRHAGHITVEPVANRPFHDPRLSRSGPTIAIIMEFSKPVTDRKVHLHTVPIYRGLPVTQLTAEGAAQWL